MLVIVGDVGSGKDKLIERALYGKFDEDKYIPTVFENFQYCFVVNNEEKFVRYDFFTSKSTIEAGKLGIFR